jgi:hypothetical protein
VTAQQPAALRSSSSWLNSTHDIWFLFIYHPQEAQEQVYIHMRPPAIAISSPGLVLAAGEAWSANEDAHHLARPFQQPPWKIKEKKRWSDNEHHKLAYKQWHQEDTNSIRKKANEVHSCVYDFQVLVLDWWCVALSRVYRWLVRHQHWMPNDPVLVGDKEWAPNILPHIYVMLHCYLLFYALLPCS